RNLLMDLGEQTQRVTFMIRDRGSNFTAAFDAVLVDAGIRTVLCNVRTPRMNAVAERAHRVAGVGEQVAVRELAALRTAGRARGIDDGRQIRRCPPGPALFQLLLADLRAAGRQRVQAAGSPQLLQAGEPAADTADDLLV